MAVPPLHTWRGGVCHPSFPRKRESRLPLPLGEGRGEGQGKVREGATPNGAPTGCPDMMCLGK